MAFEHMEHSDSQDSIEAKVVIDLTKNQLKELQNTFIANNFDQIIGMGESSDNRDAIKEISLIDLAKEKRENQLFADMGKDIFSHKQTILATV